MIVKYTILENTGEARKSVNEQRMFNYLGKQCH